MTVRRHGAGDLRSRRTELIPAAGAGLASESKRLLHDQPLERLQAIGRVQTQSSQSHHGRFLVTEEALEEIHRLEHALVLTAPRALVAAQGPESGEVAPVRQSGLQGLDQGSGVHEAEIDALTGERMDGMGRIADERDARTYIGLGMLQP